MKRAVADTPTMDKILDVAERLVQTRGFNGFSYADVAQTLGIRKPSIHHHFASKSALGERLVARYTERFMDALASIKGGTASARLRRYAALYRKVLQDSDGERMCLCGMMAAEIGTLPHGLRKRIQQFFDRNEEWLAGLFDSGRRSGQLQFRDTPRDAARRTVSSLEGAMLVSRAQQDPARFDRHVAGLLADLKP
ncbi:MAG: TetR/AcrR family transcriptional regulator [Planctomycetes bacterium]|nr:TetR/AcrR family transcriptional regulator [Planctomycetota bacterium]